MKHAGMSLAQAQLPHAPLNCKLCVQFVREVRGEELLVRRPAMRRSRKLTEILAMET